MEQQRFLLAMILSALVIFGWQAFFAPDPDQMVDEEELEAPVEQQVDPEEPELAEPAPVDQPDEPQPEPDQPDEPEQVAEPEPEQLDEVDEVDEVDEPVPDVEQRRDLIVTENMRIELSNRGAVVTGAEIVAPDQFARGSGGELLRAFRDIDVPAWPFEMTFEEGNLQVAGDAMYELVEEESERIGDADDERGIYETITYRYTDPNQRFTLDKIYSINPDARDDEQFALDLDVEVNSLLQEGEGVLAGEPHLDIISRDDPDKEEHFFDFRPDLLEGVCHNTEDTERTAFENLEGYEQYVQHHVHWAGTDTRYFITAAVPIDGASGCSFDFANDDFLQTRLYHDSITIAPGDSWQQSYLLFLGPKDFDVLTRTGHELNESVDYGLFSFLARPLRWSLSRLHDFTHNWGLAIILLTFIIKMFLWPITGKAYRSTEKMKQIQPQIKEIREKYEDDQQRMTEETMKLFRENDVSPLGCLPLLLQLPILYGLFVMIYNSVELYQAEFLWYADLSAPDPFYALPIVMGVVMFFQQKITMSASAAGKPQMKIVMKIMPVAFTAFMLFLPAGLVLYYLLNLLIGLLQQFLIKRKFRKAEEAGEEI